MKELKQEHFIATKWIVRYIKRSINYGLIYTSSDDTRLVGYVDSDSDGDLDERKITSCYMLTIALQYSRGHQRSKQLRYSHPVKQSILAQHNTPVKQYGSKYLLNEMHHSQNSPTQIYLDSMLAIAPEKNMVAHGRSKHIDTKCHFLRRIK